MVAWSTTHRSRTPSRSAPSACTSCRRKPARAGPAGRPPAPTPRRPPAAPPAGAIDAAIHALTLLVDARFAADLARYADEVELVVLPATNSRRVQPTDFEHAARLTGEALAACRKLLSARPVLAPAA